MSTEEKGQRHKWRLIIAVSAGNAFEWFDFVIFGYFAIAIAKQFFPASHPTSSLLLTLAVFGTAFVTRPIGAIVLGYYSDRRGRKPALILTISLMTLGMALVAFAPSYDSIGALATWIVLAGRLMQGFSAGGEFGSATALLAEQDPRSRGFYASWQFTSQAIALVLASSFGAALSTTLKPGDLDSWGWRIPFVLGVLIGPIGIYIRNRIPESLEFQSTQQSRSPAREVLSSFKSRTLIAFGLVTVATVTVYTLVFMPTFAVQYLGYSPANGFLASLCTGTIQMILIPIAGTLSDRWGRLPIASAASTAILLTAVPLLMQVTAAPTFANLLMFQVLIGTLLAIYLGALPAMMAELFSTRIRTTGLSVSYSFAVAAFGGFAPFINAFLVDLTGSTAAPGYYVAAAAVVSFLALIAGRKFGLK